MPLLEPREVARYFPIEFGEIARDHRQVEASENRLLRLAVEQEAERRLDKTLGRVLPACQPIARLARHRDVVTGLTPSFTDDNLEIERVVLCNSPDFNHVDHLSRLSAHYPGTGGRNQAEAAEQEQEGSSAAEKSTPAHEWPAGAYSFYRHDSALGTSDGSITPSSRAVRRSRNAQVAPRTGSPRA